MGVLTGAAPWLRAGPLQAGQLGLKPDSAVEQLGSLVQEAVLYLHTAAKRQSGSMTSGLTSPGAKYLMATSSLGPQDGIIILTGRLLGVGRRGR